MNDKRIWEAKANYVEKVMAENSEVDTLTEEQHEILRELCALRHELHVNHNSIFHSNDEHLVDKFNNFSQENELPFFIDIEELVTALDYDLLSSDEIDKYERKAEEFNNTKSERQMYHSGFSLWCEEHFEECSNYLENLNDQIESYLANIDKQHGTQYAPTGISRAKQY